MSTTFSFTETEPVPLLKDFSVFVEYLKMHRVGLTSSREFIGGKDLYALNQEMTEPISNTTSRTPQTLYPLLHLFYHLGLAGKLIQKISGKGNKQVLEPTDRLALYEDLKPAEQYFFLLETLWVDTDFKQLLSGQYGYLPIDSIPLLMEFFSESKEDKKKWTNALGHLMSNLGYIVLHFDTFGFWEVTLGQTRKDMPKHWVEFKSVALTEFGQALAPVFAYERDFYHWNLPIRRQEFGEWRVEPGDPLDDADMHEEIVRLLKETMGGPSKTLRKAYQGKPGEPFYLPFVSLVEEGALERTLPREGISFVDGTYRFKVSLGRNLWRRIEVSARHRLLDLHDAIQSAYAFDDDHLYAFFMDGKAWSDEKFASPYNDEGPFVDDVQIGELGLSEGQRILYLFDYGDEWRFQVTLEEIRQEEPKPRRPKIVEKKGKAPEQYGY